VETDVTKRVLIVDDDLMVIPVLREFFAYLRHGHAYEITSARSVAEGRDILLRERFDLILLDMAMPQTGDRGPWQQGLDLLKRVRDLGIRTPVLMMTGGWDTEKKAEAMNDGALGHLYKPFALCELDHLVTFALGSGPRASGG
jgi:DNA-binding NtrC family response regulator